MLQSACVAKCICCKVHVLQVEKKMCQAIHSLTKEPSTKSWFNKIRAVCQMYGLPHLLTILKEPLSKEVFKKMVKSHESCNSLSGEKLREEASLLPSLEYSNPYFHSLARPHPLLPTPGSNPHEVAKAVV